MSDNTHERNDSSPAWARTIEDTWKYSRKHPPRALALALIAIGCTLIAAVTKPLVQQIGGSIAARFSGTSDVIDTRTFLGRQFAWSDEGGSEYSRPVVGATPQGTIRADGTTLILKYDWSEGELNGTLQGTTYTGHWHQQGEKQGSGSFELTFSDRSYSKANGWWDRGDDTTKLPAFIR